MPPAAALDSPNLGKGTEFISIHYGLGVAHLLSSCHIQMVTHLFSSFKDFQEFCKEDIRHSPPPRHTHTNPVCSVGVGVSAMESKAQHLVRTSQEENSIPLAHASLSWMATGWGQEPPQGLCSKTHHLPWNVSVQIEFRPLAYYLLVSPHPHSQERLSSASASVRERGQWGQKQPSPDCR